MRKRKHKGYKGAGLIAVLLAALVAVTGYEHISFDNHKLDIPGQILAIEDALKNNESVNIENTNALAELEYEGKSYTLVNDGVPEFSEEELKKAKEGEFLELKELDSLGRCQVASACVSRKTLAEGERGSISMIRPSGWPKRIASAKYDFVDGKMAFNRCHLIMHKLYGDITNDERNLITGTRQLNAGDNGKDGMLTFEKQIVNYVENSKDKVLYKVTPIYRGDELIPRGVQMEAEGIDGDFELNIYVFNVQDRLDIDYYTGETKEI